ncbi:MAG: TetR/AcrR family transcriptional regulator [Candidatus Methylomirabilis sp.]|nr:TetR/AcrR family transcriptional regulator [Deltaproteobacteria bacterium]
MSTRAREDWQKEERREAIVQAAEALFVEAGGVTPSVGAVAERAGLAKGTVYLYFKSKEELFAAVMESRFLRWIEDIDRGFDLLGERWTVEGAVEAFVAPVIADPLVIRLATYSNVVDTPAEEIDSDLAWRARLAKAIDGIARRIEAGIPDLKPGDGAGLLIKSYAYILGAWQFVPPALVMEEIRKREDLAVYRLELGPLLESGLVALWNGVLAAARAGRGAS